MAYGDTVVASGLVGGVKVNDKKVVGAQDAFVAASHTAITHAVGTADHTIADVGGAFNQATLNDNFKELSVKVNAILVVLKNHGLLASA